jgi:hypothetical protein
MPTGCGELREAEKGMGRREDEGVWWRETGNGGGG